MKMKCPSCGTKFDVEERYCPYCYARVSKSNSIQLDKGRYTSIKMENHSQGMKNQYSRSSSKKLIKRAESKQIKLALLVFLLVFGVLFIIPLLVIFGNLFFI